MKDECGVRLVYYSGSPEVGSVPLHQRTLDMWTFTEKVSKRCGWDPKRVVKRLEDSVWNGRGC